MQGSCPFGFSPSPGSPRPPKARGLPLVGHVFKLLYHPWKLFQDCERSLGSSFRLSVAGLEATVLTGPLAREFFSEEGEAMIDQSFIYQSLAKELDAAELIFLLKGARHRQVRRCASLAFSRQVAAEHVPEAAQAMLRHIASLTPGRSYDVMDLTADALTVAAGPLIAQCDVQPVLPALKLYCTTMMQVAGCAKLPLALWGPKYRRARRVSLDFGRELLKHWRQKGDAERSHATIIGCLDAARYDDGSPLADRDIIYMTLATCIGSAFYINRVVSFMLHELFRDEDLRRQVTEEIQRAFAGGIRYEALREMPLLTAVYFETLRRYPIWFAFPCRSTREFDYEGKRIRKGDLQLISLTQEHFDPRFYPEPERFDPWRCLPPRNEHRQPGAFAPFGAGGRRCIATGQTEVLSMLCVAVLLGCTRFEARPDRQLKVRSEPLPGPSGFDLTFQGMLDAAARPSAPAQERQAPTPAQVEAFGDRLSGEEMSTFYQSVDQQMQVMTFEPGSEIFHQGDTGDAFFVIESGAVELHGCKEGGAARLLAVMGAGQVVGETALLKRLPHPITARVSADSAPVVALRCTLDAYERLLGELNLVGEELIALIRRRKVTDSFARLTSRLDRHQIQALMPEASFRRGHPGEVFIRQGDEADAFFIIEKGEFEVTLRTADGAEIFVRHLGAGDFFGEIGLLQNLPRTASVRVAAGCEAAECLVLDRSAFHRLIHPESPLRENVFQEFSQYQTGYHDLDGSV